MFHLSLTIIMAETSPTPPKVFISYSWTSEEHSDWVAELGERLMSDGIDVVLDQWDLQDGQDLNDFMEQMVKDPEIKRVIIVSDAAYATKADDRRGGVGTETQIISQEVYESVDQTKFVPVLRERDAEGKECLPVYLKSRKYIDFSDADDDAKAYEQLLRNIYERPLRAKPALGKAPAHLFDDSATVVSAAQKAKRFCEFVASGRGNPTAAFSDFADEFIENMNDLRMVYSREGADTWCERIRANIHSATVHRDVFVDVIRAGINLPSAQFLSPFLGFLEQLLPLQEQPENAGSFYEYSEDNYKLLCYEFFLYSVAAFIKSKRYDDARQLIDHRYVASQTFGGTNLKGHGFQRFNAYASSLEEHCSRQGDRRRLSVMADLIHKRATNKHIRFHDVLQADVILWLASKTYGWYPRCLIYGGSSGKLELFLRAETDAGFLPLKTLLHLDAPLSLLQKIESLRNTQTMQSEAFWHAFDDDCLNLESLQRKWGSQPR